MHPTTEYKILKEFDLRSHPKFLNKQMYDERLSKYINTDQIEIAIESLAKRELLNRKTVGVELSQSGKVYLDDTYYNEYAYDIIDDILIKLKKGNDGIGQIEHPRNNQRINKLVESILDKYSLVTFLNKNRAVSVVELELEGYTYRVLEEFKGIRNYIRFIENGATYEGTQEEYETISSKVDEILSSLEKAGVEREILFNEMQELKELYLKLNKKNWKQIVLGKLADMVLGKIIEPDIMSSVYHHLTGDFLPKLIGQ